MATRPDAQCGQVNTFFNKIFAKVLTMALYPGILQKSGIDPTQLVRYKGVGLDANTGIQTQPISALRLARLMVLNPPCRRTRGFCLNPRARTTAP